MKKKLIAILISVIMVFTCMVAFAGCDNGTTDNGTTGNGGNTTNTGDNNKDDGEDKNDEENKKDEEDKKEEETTPPKTTVDNFDEWYKALRDTLTAENYTVQSNITNVIRQQTQKATANGSRAGKYTYFKLTEGEETSESYYENNGAKIVRYIKAQHLYDESAAYWYTYEDNVDEDSFGTKLFYEISYGPFADEFSMTALSLLYGYGDVSTEETAKENAKAFYDLVTYDEENSAYKIELNFSSVPLPEAEPNTGTDIINFTLKFKDDKIEKLEIQFAGITQNNPDEKTPRTYNISHTLTYGDATVTLPEEVKTSVALTEALHEVAAGLKGMFTYEYDGNTCRLEFYYSTNFDLISSTGRYELNTNTSRDSSSFKWEVLSAVKVGLIFDDGTKAELEIGEGALTYKDEDGKIYTFTKNEQE